MASRPGSDDRDGIRAFDIFEAAPDGIVVVDHDGAMLAVNVELLRTFGYTAGELEGRPVEILIPGRFHARHVGYRETYAARPGRRPMGGALELFGRRKNGEEFPVDVSLNSTRDDTGRDLVVAFVRDITARRKAEQAWRDTEERLEIIAERERIARDLHDTVIQRLFAIGLALEATGRLPTAQMTERVHRAVADIDGTIRAIRSSIFSLESRAEDPPSVRRQVLDVIADETSALGFEPTVSFDGPVDTLTDHDIAADLVATLREALSNVARHARANRTTVTITAGDAITLTVEDDGIGAASPHRDGGHGITNMRGRAQQHGGTLDIGQVAPHGTRLQWRVPTLGRRQP